MTYVNITDKFRTIEPRSGSYTENTDDELIITARGEEYDDLIKDQWTLNDIDNEEYNDNERDKEVYGDGAKEQGTMNEEIGTEVEMPPQKQKGI